MELGGVPVAGRVLIPRGSAGGFLCSGDYAGGPLIQARLVASLHGPRESSLMCCLEIWKVADLPLAGGIPGNGLADDNPDTAIRIGFCHRRVFLHIPDVFVSVGANGRAQRSLFLTEIRLRGSLCLGPIQLRHASPHPVLAPGPIAGQTCAAGACILTEGGLSDPRHPSRCCRCGIWTRDGVLVTLHDAGKQPRNARSGQPCSGRFFRSYFRLLLWTSHSVPKHDTLHKS